MIRFKWPLFAGKNRNIQKQLTYPSKERLAQRARIIKSSAIRAFPAAAIKHKEAGISFPSDYGFREKIELYRFLRDQIPIISGAIWVWVRLCSSPMKFQLVGPNSQRNAILLANAIDDLNRRLAPNPYYKSAGIDLLSDLFFSSLFVDGAFAGNIDFDDSSRIISFKQKDIRNLSFEYEGNPQENQLKIYENEELGRTLMDSSSFIYVPLDSDIAEPRGRSILQSIGFVSRLEQKLLDDMQKSQEKAGYNRLQVLIKKPEKRIGETDNAYIERANNYFDDTVKLFSDIRPSDSAVTWDDIEIRTVGGGSGGNATSHSWYLSHRALVEDICAGVHLDPFMLGYSYGTTQTWAAFKYELILRQIVSVQKSAIEFFEWLVNGYLKAERLNLSVKVSFDNNGFEKSVDRLKSLHEESDRIMKLFSAGLISKEEARSMLPLNLTPVEP